MTETRTREEWLGEVAELVKPQFAAVGMPLDKVAIRVTCGFPSTKARATRRRAVGECWPKQSSDDKTSEVFVSPVLDDPIEVAAVLVHELVHAGDDCKHGHKGPFVRVCRALGLGGKPSSTVPTEQFEEWISPILDRVGPYPHRKLNIACRQKKQSTRLLKVECPDCLSEGEPYIARMSRAAIERGLPICPFHETEMTEAA